MRLHSGGRAVTRLHSELEAGRRQSLGAGREVRPFGTPSDRGDLAGQGWLAFGSATPRSQTPSVRPNGALHRPPESQRRRVATRMSSTCICVRRKSQIMPRLVAGGERSEAHQQGTRKSEPLAARSTTAPPCHVAAGRSPVTPKSYSTT